MTNQTTINKLIEMRLTALADAFRNQTNDPKMKDIPFDDRLGMLVDIEYTSRKNNRLRRLIRKAEFEQSDASIMDINYTSGRKLNKSLIQRLASCEYITEHRNIFVTGATGSGKSYLACALGMEACKQYYTVVTGGRGHCHIWKVTEFKGGYGMFLIDTECKKAIQLDKKSFSELKLAERYDLQEWIVKK